MTNAELISKIKGEIERLKEEAYNSILPDEPKYRTHYKVGKKELCEELLSFLSTLESEKPMNLDEEIDNYFKHWTEDEYTGAACHYQYVNLNDCRGIARHFAKWGAEHAKKDEIPVPSDLEEAADEGAKQYYIEGGYSPFPNIETNAYKAGFFAGAKWQAEQLLKGSPLPEDTVIYQKGVEEGKRLMMEEAVEVENVVEEGRYCQEIGPIFLDERAGFKPGDKVRVIVIPNTDKK